MTSHRRRRECAFPRLFLPAALIASLFAPLSGCGDSPAPSTREAFENLLLTVHALDGAEVQLRDRSALLEELGIQILLDDLHLTGIAGSPARRITTGILYVEGPASQYRTELVVAEEVDGTMQHIATHPLGARLRVEGIRYQDGAIVVHLIDYAPDDPPCCPSLPLEERFSLEGQEVRPVIAEASGS